MIIPGLKQLVTPLNYLRIRRKTVKQWYDWYIPFGFTVVLLGLLNLFPDNLNVFGSGGLIHQVTELLKMLVGFYIAALAAVSTFPSATLDECLDGDPTTLKVKRRGVKITIPLSRRRFLSYLFGYLSFMSLMLFIAGTMMLVVAADIREMVEGDARKWLETVGLFVYAFWINNILVATLLGLHYLTDRIHRPVDGNVSTQANDDTSNPR